MSVMHPEALEFKNITTGWGHKWENIHWLWHHSPLHQSPMIQTHMVYLVLVQGRGWIVVILYEKDIPKGYTFLLAGCHHLIFLSPHISCIYFIFSMFSIADLHFHLFFLILLGFSIYDSLPFFPRLGFYYFAAPTWLIAPLFQYTDTIGK